MLLPMKADMRMPCSCPGWIDWGQTIVIHSAECRGLDDDASGRTRQVKSGQVRSDQVKVRRVMQPRKMSRIAARTVVYENNGERKTTRQIRLVDRPHNKAKAKQAEEALSSSETRATFPFFPLSLS